MGGLVAYLLGVDLGTTFVTAALSLTDAQRIELGLATGQSTVKNDPPEDGTGSCQWSSGTGDTAQRVSA